VCVHQKLKHTVKGRVGLATTPNAPSSNLISFRLLVGLSDISTQYVFATSALPSTR
jgi:hypothetical protein